VSPRLSPPIYRIVEGERSVRLFASDRIGVVDDNGASVAVDNGGSSPNGISLYRIDIWSGSTAARRPSTILPTVIIR
jgi:hypothetical protein